MIHDNIRIIRLEDILPDLRKRPKTLEEVIVNQETQEFSIKAIKNILHSLQENFHRLNNKGVAELESIINQPEETANEKN